MRGKLHQFFLVTTEFILALAIRGKIGYDEEMVLTSTSEVIAKLGGISAVSILTGKSYDAVEAWKRSPNFPANTFIVLNDALKERGFSAPTSLWRMVEKVQ